MAKLKRKKVMVLEEKKRWKRSRGSTTVTEGKKGDTEEEYE
jgi:hypothetical protein